MAPLAHAAASEFCRRNTPCEVSTEPLGSWAGVADLFTGSADAVFCDITFAYERDGLVASPIAAFPIAFVANPRAGVSSLTRTQLRSILRGRITNWSQVGGADLPILIVNRSRASGVRAIVEELLFFNGGIAESPCRANSNRTAALMVNDRDGAISYAAVPGTDDLDVVRLAIDGVRPSNERVLDGSYAFFGCGRLLASPADDAARRFADFLLRQSDLPDALGYIGPNRDGLEAMCA